MYNYEKSCGIPFFCLWRPEIKVYDHDEELLGSIHNIFKWWKMVMEIRDTHDDPVYEVSASKINAGFIWEPLCATCSPITFDIKDLRKDGLVVSTVVKHFQGWGTELCNNAGKKRIRIFFYLDKYYLDFSSVMTYEERVCLSKKSK